MQYFGTYVEQELDKVGQKRDRKAAKVEADRKRLLEKLLDPTPEKPKKGQFLDPAFFFQQ